MNFFKPEDFPLFTEGSPKRIRELAAEYANYKLAETDFDELCIKICSGLIIHYDASSNVIVFNFIKNHIKRFFSREKCRHPKESLTHNKGYYICECGVAVVPKIFVEYKDE